MENMHGGSRWLIFLDQAVSATIGGFETKMGEDSSEQNVDEVLG